MHATAKFECQASAFGNVEVVWKRVYAKLPIKSMITTKIQSDKITSILSITRTNKYYEGGYFCVVTNDAGNAISNQAHLYVKGMYVCIY